MSDNAAGVLLVSLYLAGLVLGFVWAVVLPVVGLMYMCGALK